jgi:hypothetical protein
MRKYCKTREEKALNVELTPPGGRISRTCWLRTSDRFADDEGGAPHK